MPDFVQKPAVSPQNQPVPQQNPEAPNSVPPQGPAPIDPNPPKPGDKTWNGFVVRPVTPAHVHSESGPLAQAWRVATELAMPAYAHPDGGPGAQNPFDAMAHSGEADQLPFVPRQMITNPLLLSNTDTGPIPKKVAQAVMAAMSVGLWYLAIWMLYYTLSGRMLAGVYAWHTFILILVLMFVAAIFVFAIAMSYLTIVAITRSQETKGTEIELSSAGIRILPNTQILYPWSALNSVELIVYEGMMGLPVFNDGAGALVSKAVNKNIQHTVGLIAFDFDEPTMMRITHTADGAVIPGWRLFRLTADYAPYNFGLAFEERQFTTQGAAWGYDMIHSAFYLFAGPKYRGYRFVHTS
jgi:hypothetical protein